MTDNFNPLGTEAPLQAMGATAFIYEPLLQYNELQVDQYYPWLAQSWAFSTSGKTVTFSLRKGVKWDDGSAFTASDVAYTFNLLKADPAVGNGLPIVSAVATDPGTFTLTLSKPGYAYLYDIALVPIVKAGFAQGHDPSTYVDRRPDGTGPYELARPGDVSRAQVVLTARRGYWQPNAPSIQRLVFPAYRDATAARDALAKGEIDWAGNFMPDVGRAYEHKDRSANHFWAPAVDCVALQLNMGHAPLDQLAVRQAVSLSVGRQALSGAVSGGHDPPATTSTGLVTPLDNQYVPVARRHDLRATADLGRAASLLEAAGFTKDARGYWASAHGGVISFDIAAPAAGIYSSAASVVARQLRSAGFDVTTDRLGAQQWASTLASGRFDSALVPGVPGPSPFYTDQAWLSSKAATPVGTGATHLASLAASAMGRYAGSPSDSTAARAALLSVAGYVSAQVPVVPLVYDVAWAEFSTRHANGWPNGPNPYEPATPAAPFDEYTVLQLNPASG